MRIDMKTDMKIDIKVDMEIGIKWFKVFKKFDPNNMYELDNPNQIIWSR